MTSVLLRACEIPDVAIFDYFTRVRKGFSSSLFRLNPMRDDCASTLLLLDMLTDGGSMCLHSAPDGPFSAVIKDSEMDCSSPWAVTVSADAHAGWDDSEG